MPTRINKLALALAAALVFILAGCSAGGEMGEATAATQSAPQVCTFSIECSTALSENSGIDAELAAILPPDGVILAECEVALGDGESVADALRRVCADNGIALETSFAPIYGSVYVEGICNLYEFDCGAGSGWMYSVNGEFPNRGASSYVLSPGDRVEWRYTCDFGEDIGGGNGTH